MLQRLTWEEFMGWMAYAEIEPFDETRADLRAASICSLLANINRDTKKKPKPFTISDFVLTFDPDEIKAVQPKKQTWQEQKMWAQIYAAAFNEPEKPKRRRPPMVVVPPPEEKSKRRRKKPDGD